MGVKRSRVVGVAARGGEAVGVAVPSATVAVGEGEGEVAAVEEAVVETLEVGPPAPPPPGVAVGAAWEGLPVGLLPGASKEEEGGGESVVVGEEASVIEAAAEVEGAEEEETVAPAPREGVAAAGVAVAPGESVGGVEALPWADRVGVELAVLDTLPEGAWGEAVAS